MFRTRLCWPHANFAHDPAELGFKSLARNAVYGYVPQSIGFADQQEREAAFQHYEEMIRNVNLSERED